MDAGCDGTGRSRIGSLAGLYGRVRVDSTVQGYDLNGVGVIIGRDLRLDEASYRIVDDQANYFDKKGVESNGFLGNTYSDDEGLAVVRDFCAVLPTRGPWRLCVRRGSRVEIQNCTDP